LRADKFLNSVNIVKRRSIAQDMIANSVVFVDGKPIKASKELKVNDIIEIRYLDETKQYQILKIPETKSISKSQKDEYVKELN